MPTTNMQKEVLKAIELNLEAEGYVLQLEYNAANVGILRAVPDGNFTSLYPMWFDFQKQYANFKYAPEGRGQPVRREWSTMITYSHGEEEFTTKLQNVIDFLKDGKLP